MRIVVFLGPTMPVAQARAILPDAVYLPPVRQADVLSALRTWQPDVIAIIDGVFHQSLAVWHKEILAALDQGTAVYGSSSMGALRAVECAPFGMVGVGQVYQWFEDGTLTDDDEVALAHADEEQHWRPLSVPMVNIRATLTAAVRAGALDSAGETLILDAAKALYYPERTWSGALTGAAAAGLPSVTAGAFRRFLPGGAVDQKLADARELLVLLAGLDAKPQAPERDWNYHRSHLFEALSERDVRVNRPAGEISLEAIARYVLLHRPDAVELLERACARTLVQQHAAQLQVTVTDEDVDEQIRRFRVRRHLSTQPDLDRYLLRNDLLLGEFRVLMRQLAVQRRLTDWLRIRRNKLGLTQLLLDELRLQDSYGQWADAAAEQSLLLDTEVPLPTRPVPLRELVRDQANSTGWRPDTDVGEWAERVGLGNTADLTAELSRSWAVRRYVRDLLGAR